jgi:hypothetical protein
MSNPIDYPKPTHIDFITAYKDKNQHRGYWIMTWIFHTGDVVVWRRLKRGWELCNKREGRTDFFAEVGEDPQFYDFYCQATTEHYEYLEKTLHDYMKKHSYAGEPYEYWKPYERKKKERYELAQQYKGEVAIAISKKQLLEEKKKNKGK